MELNKPSVLVLTDWYVPGFKAGGPITSLFRMVQLLSKDFDFEIFTRNTDWFDNKPYEVIFDQWLAQADSKIFYSSGNHFFKIIKFLKKEYSIVFFNGLYSPFFNALPLILLLLFNKRKRIVVAPRGMLNQNAIALKSFKKTLLLRLLKRLNIASKVEFHAASSAEVQAIKVVFPKARITHASNVPMLPTRGRDYIQHNIPTFISVGRISAVKNTLSLIDLFKTQSYKLELIGSHDDQKYFQQCLESMNKSQNIRLTEGLDPASLSVFYSKCNFFISVTTGENFGHAIVEALAHGIPVIISDQTPWQDIEEKGAGWVIPLKDQKRWKEVIKEAASLSEQAYAEMSNMALAYVRQKFNFEEIRQQYLQLFNVKN